MGNTSPNTYAYYDAYDYRHDLYNNDDAGYNDASVHYSNRDNDGNNNNVDRTYND